MLFYIAACQTVDRATAERTRPFFWNRLYSGVKFGLVRRGSPCSIRLGVGTSFLLTKTSRKRNSEQPSGEYNTTY